jgi:hypothetical protein
MVQESSPKTTQAAFTLLYQKRSRWLSLASQPVIDAATEFTSRVTIVPIHDVGLERAQGKAQPSGLDQQALQLVENVL